jgi:hypothetical protein
MRIEATLAAVLLSGCVGAEGLQLELAKSRAELMYVHAPPLAERQPGTVALGKVAVEAALPKETTVEKTGGFVVPLVLFNLWWADYRSELGAAQLQNDLATFTRSSLAEALRRGARYAWAEQGGDLTVDVTVRKATTDAPLGESGEFVFLLVNGSAHKTFNAGPATVTLDGEVVMRRGDVELVRRPIQAKGSSIGILRGSDVSIIQDFTPAMGEALSLAVKAFADEVVRTVNEAGTPELPDTGAN